MTKRLVVCVVLLLFFTPKTLLATIVKGTLPNGLTYYIIPRTAHRGEKMEVRLVLPVGAAQEEGGIRGVAHFIEHMAFGGSRHFPGRTMVELIEEQGALFGYGMNAYTGYDRTIYQLTLPQKDSTLYHRALLMARDWIDGLTFDMDRIETERKIIREEIRMADVDDPFYALKMGYPPHTPIVLPVGTAETIQSITRSDLLHFYQRWYTPQHATLIIASATDPAIVEQSIHQLFSSITKRSERIPKPYPLVYDSGRVATHMIQDSLRREHRLEWMQAYSAPKSFLERLQRNILLSRIEQLLHANDIHFSNDWYLGDTDHFVVTVDGDAPTINAEIRRLPAQLKYLAEHPELIDGDGALDRLIEETCVKIRPLSEKNAVDRTIELIIEGVVLPEAIPFDKKEAERLCTELRQTTADRLAMILSQILKGSTLLGITQASVISPLNINDLQGLLALDSISPQRVVPFQSLKVIAKEDDTRPLTFAELGQIGLFANHPVPPQEHVYLPHIDTHLYHFPNGLTLVVKPLADCGDNVSVTLSAPGGLSLIPDSDYARLEGVGGYIDMGSIRSVPASNSWLDLHMAHNLSLTSAISNTHHGLYAHTDSANVLPLMRTIALKLTEPHIDVASLEEVKQDELEALHRPSVLARLLANDPVADISHFKSTLLGTASRRIDTHPDDIRAISAQELELFYTRLYGNLTNTTLIVVGHVDPGQVAHDVGRTLGAMQSFDPIPTPKKIDAPTTSVSVNSVKVPTIGRVTAYHLLSGNFTPSLRSTLELKLVRELLRARLMATLREKLGIVYAPHISLFYSTNGTPATFCFELENSVDASALPLLNDTLQELLIEMRRPGSFTSDELLSIKRRLLANKSDTLTSDALMPWRDTLLEMTEHGFGAMAFEHYDEILQEITVDDLTNYFEYLCSSQTTQTHFYVQ